MENLAQNLGFSGAVCMSAIGLAGGSCLLWNKNINLHVNYAVDGYFEATVCDTNTQFLWKLMAVYGTPYVRDKENFWNYLETEANHFHLPWVILGDLNCIGSKEEKVGGSKVTVTDLRWLRNFQDNTGCVDLRFIGNKFTWQNKRFHGGLIRERLDRALCSGDWMNNYDYSGVLNLPITISDHAPIILDTHLFATKGFIPFRFYEAWTWESSCRGEIERAWCCPSTEATTALVRNVSNTRKALQGWKKKIQGVTDTDIKAMEKRLEWIQQQPISTDLKREEALIQDQLIISWSKQESMWRQRSRETWLALGDRNTKFFHTATNIRRRRNSIWAIKDKEGRIWKDKMSIGRVINAHFTELYTSTRPVFDDKLENLEVKSISHSENEEMSRTPSVEEIKSAVFSLHPLKAPGPDGFSGCFFRKFWDIVGPCLCSSVQEAFETGVIDPRINNTFVCLIPKVEFALGVDQYRPISLCNFSYKVIAKILSNRMRPLMEELVSPFQSAFIPGRWIAESSILTQELVHKIKAKRGRGGLMAIKLDMHKAYDKMEWSFIQKVLSKNGFNGKSIRLLMACVTSVSYSVLLNGCPLKKLYPQRGLRQGDPISPFLFLLCQDVLSKMITQAEEEGYIQGIKIAQSSPSISHLMFADDTILFARANETNARNLLKYLSDYESWSGQTCSKSKSGILFSKNTNAGLKNNILNILNINQVSGEEKHLGNPFIFKRRKAEDYNRLKDSMRSKLEGWKMKSLSYAGRLTLIKSVAASIPIYAMSTQKVPISTCRGLDSLMRKYWWKGSVEKDRYMAYRAWDKICTPKSMGGLGLRRCEDMNKALMTKLAWCLGSKMERPWVTCMLEKYCKHDSFWCVNQKSNDSPLWKSVLGSREVLLQGSMATAASGESINFWKQPWIPWMEYREFLDLMQLLGERRYTIKTLADVSLGNRWNEEVIIQIFGHELGERILNIPRIPSPFPDQMFWKENRNGKFSVKSAYVVDQKWRFEPGQRIWKWIWDGRIHPRISIFLWRILNEAIPTKNKLPFVPIKDCGLCGKEGESALHLFRSCSFTKAMWMGSQYPLRIDNIPGESMVIFLENLISIFPISCRIDLVFFFGCLCNEIWNQRNASCIRNATGNPIQALWNVGKALTDFKVLIMDSAKESLVPTPSLEATVYPDAPTCMHHEKVDYVVFTDASWDKGETGVAAIIINMTEGNWLVKARKTTASCPLEAEFKAIEMALQWAVAEKKMKILILSDSKIAVNSLSANEGCPDWKCASLFFSVINLSRKLLVSKFIFISRSLNVVADGVAKNARLSSFLDVLYQGEGMPPVVPITFSS
ncbi:hypothetical protein CsatB_014040 [Cannabis sativa]